MEKSNARTFWEQHEADNYAFQEVQLLNIIAEYLIITYNKISYCTSFFGGKAYI